MTLNLFDTSDVVVEEGVTTVEEIHQEISIGQRFFKMLEDYKTAVKNWAAARSSIAEEENTYLPEKSYMLVFKPLDPSDHKQLIIEAERNVRDRLIRHAEEKFAPSGQTLKIDKTELPVHFVCDRETAGIFNPTAFWLYLETTYAGSSGQELAWAQAAEEVVRAFHMSRSGKVERKGAYIVLNRSVYIDSYDKKYGKLRPSYSSQQIIAECCKSLAKFASWAERPDLADDLHEVEKHFCWHNYAIESRKQFNCGKSGIVVVTFLTNFEYRIHQDLATQLQIFIGTYAPNAMRD